MGRLLALCWRVGAAEHGAEHFVEHGESSVREDRFHLARENDK